MNLLQGDIRQSSFSSFKLFVYSAHAHTHPRSHAVCVCFGSFPIQRVSIASVMASAAAALLDELMGRSRNVIPGKDVQEMNWDDSEVTCPGAYPPLIIEYTGV